MNTEVKDANGFDTTALGGLAEQLKKHPEGGRVTFHSSSKWSDGAQVATQLRGYTIDGTLHHQDQRQHTVSGDEPVEFGAGDAAPAPPEMLMHAIANCILATTNAYAALQGVRLTCIDARLESDVDLHGMFGLNEKTRPGLGEIRATIEIAGDADASTLEELVNLGLRHSPIRDSVENGVPIRASVAARASG